MSVVSKLILIESVFSYDFLSQRWLKFNFFESCILSNRLVNIKAGLYDEIFLSRAWNFYFERKVSKWFRKRSVCREISFSLFTQSTFIHTIMIRFHSWRELTIFIFLVIDITVLNHVWKYWKRAHNYVVNDWGKIRWRRWTS